MHVVPAVSFTPPQCSQHYLDQEYQRQRKEHDHQKHGDNDEHVGTAAIKATTLGVLVILAHDGNPRLLYRGRRPRSIRGSRCRHYARPRQLLTFNGLVLLARCHHCQLRRHQRPHGTSERTRTKSVSVSVQSVHKRLMNSKPRIINCGVDGRA